MASRGRFANSSVGDKNVYMETVYFIKQYDSFKKLARTIDQQSLTPSLSFQQKDGGGRITSPVEDIAMLRSDLGSRIEQVDNALKEIPEKYRKGLMENIVHNVKFKEHMFDFAHYQTWKYWKNKFICEVARQRGYEEYLKWIDTYGK